MTIEDFIRERELRARAASVLLLERWSSVIGIYAQLEHARTMRKVQRETLADVNRYLEMTGIRTSVENCARRLGPADLRRALDGLRPLAELAAI